MHLDAFALTVPGRRPNNEDAVIAAPQLGLFVVADGLGGYEGGEIASTIAVETIHELVRRTACDHDVTWPYAIDPRRTVMENELMVATRLAGDRITARRAGVLEQMGSTVAAMLVEDSAVVIAHVGDSRVYRLRGGVMSAMTVDHSLVSQMIAAGMPPDANFAYRHIITRALGMPAAEPDVVRAAVEPGDVYLLCTDGLYDPLGEAAMARVVVAGLAESPEAACRAVVDAAYAAGSRDNISAVVVRAR